ncbi:isocitrate lyase/PEP mutase family protein [Nakamurella deserti]|uniref:isocitrate lyase/PEP mutase family protein n=1 Tax=Nakamurella deserti TaxID=2164074 RepID=UPI001F0BDD9B|nr:isocitrate lyase/phosphoenolpyruvate mutase family protein [Nakamurella deserti]
MSLQDKATTFLELHRAGDPVVLPTVWDAWSATLAADAGFAGLTVGSHPVADALGRADNEGLTFDEVLGQVARITATVDLPVSVDIESGYGLEPARLVEGLVSVGAVGFNIEDTVHSQGGRLRSGQEHADLVGALRAASDAAGVHLVINARTDVFIKQTGPAESRVDLAVERLTLAAQAGADVLYPVGGHDADTWAQLAAALPLPVNAIAFPEQQTLADFAPLGVGRISFGPRLQGALGAYAGRLFAAWK